MPSTATTTTPPSAAQIQRVRRARRIRRRPAIALAIATGAFLAAAAGQAVGATVPGTPFRDVHFGPDNDNATNTFIQPPGVTAKQHMDNTDVVFGRERGDLLFGNLGGDTVIGGEGPDILVGGPERFAVPNSDVLLGDEGDDINIWAPGDGSDAYVGDKGTDTMVFGNLQTDASGSPLLERFRGRTVPRVDLGNKATQSCAIVPVPASENLGSQFLVRFLVNGNITVTVRQKDVERVVCPSPQPGHATVASLLGPNPSFQDVPLDDIRGLLGAVVAAP